MKGVAVSWKLDHKDCWPDLAEPALARQSSGFQTSRFAKISCVRTLMVGLPDFIQQVWSENILISNQLRVANIFNVSFR